MFIKGAFETCDSIIKVEMSRTLGKKSGEKHRTHLRQQYIRMSLGHTETFLRQNRASFFALPAKLGINKVNKDQTKQ